MIDVYTGKLVPQPVEPPEPEPPMRCVFGWHLYWRHEGMMGDKVVTCVNCGDTRYSSRMFDWIYRITGRLVKGEVTYKDGRYQKV